MTGSKFIHNSHTNLFSQRTFCAAVHFLVALQQQGGALRRSRGVCESSGGTLDCSHDCCRGRRAGKFCVFRLGKFSRVCVFLSFAEFLSVDAKDFLKRESFACGLR